MKKLKHHSFCAITYLFFSLLLLNTPILSAQKTNLTGHWILNLEKSKAADNPLSKGSSKILATQNDTLLTLERTFNGKDGKEINTHQVYKLNGKESENIFFQVMKRKSTASWSEDGKTLAIHSVTFYKAGDKTNELKSYEIFSLSDDKNTLSIESSFSIPNGELKSTWVYDKK